jgi:hypothetical protein
MAVILGWSGSEGLLGSGNTASKMFGPFSAIFRQICRIFGRGFSRPPIFLWGHFYVLRLKFRPVGNTVIQPEAMSLVMAFMQLGLGLTYSKFYIKILKFSKRSASFCKIFLSNLPP